MPQGENHLNFKTEPAVFICRQAEDISEWEWKEKIVENL